MLKDMSIDYEWSIFIVAVPFEEPRMVETVESTRHEKVAVKSDATDEGQNCSSFNLGCSGPAP